MTTTLMPTIAALYDFEERNARICRFLHTRKAQSLGIQAVAQRHLSYNRGVDPSQPLRFWCHHPSEPPAWKDETDTVHGAELARMAHAWTIIYATQSWKDPLNTPIITQPFQKCLPYGHDTVSLRDHAWVLLFRDRRILHIHDMVDALRFGHKTLTTISAPQCNTRHSALAWIHGHAGAMKALHALVPSLHDDAERAGVRLGDIPTGTLLDVLLKDPF